MLNEEQLKAAGAAVGSFLLGKSTVMPDVLKEDTQKKPDKNAIAREQGLELHGKYTVEEFKSAGIGCQI